jgi:hypothetical protein
VSRITLARRATVRCLTFDFAAMAHLQASGRNRSPKQMKAAMSRKLQIMNACALACTLIFGAAPALAQSSPMKPAAAHVGTDNADRKRKDMADFVAGNMLFVLLHEMAHVHVSEMGLPVLGREEDAADAYATVTMLKMGSEFSYDVLVQAAKGWFLSAERGEKAGEPLAFYDEHGLDRQRAYQIVCLMVGSDGDKFGALADFVKMPDERQATCQGDYSNASWSWEQALKSHRRAADQPKTRIETVYGEGRGDLDVNVRSLRAMRLLEAVAERASDEFVWRAPFKIEMQTCGRSAAHWDLFARRLVVCYELAEEFVQFFRDAAPVARASGSETASRTIKTLRLRDVVSRDELAVVAKPASAAAATGGGEADAGSAKLEQIGDVLNTQSLEFYAPPVRIAHRTTATGVQQARR